MSISSLYSTNSYLAFPVPTPSHTHPHSLSHAPSPQMSLLAPSRPSETERSSVLLPTITCSSCAAPIPLSNLGEHVCRPPSRSTGDRAIPRPSQLTIPAASSSSSSSSSFSASRSNTPHHDLPRQPNSSGGPSHPSRPTLNNLHIPPLSTPSPSPFSAGPSSAASGSSSNQYLGLSNPPQARTPSPTNPFFPRPGNAPGEALGLSLATGGEPRRESPYPTDRPLPAGIQGPGIDLVGAGGAAAGMAGVGRRAFAAAAWGVRAGVAMAASVSPTSGAGPSSLPHPAMMGTRSNQAGPSTPMSPSQGHLPNPYAQPAQSGQSYFPPMSPPKQSQRPMSPPQPTANYPANTFPSAPLAFTSRPTPSRQSSKEPPLLPRAPLSGRLRNVSGGPQVHPTTSFGSGPGDQPVSEGSSTSMSQRSVTAPLPSRTQESADSGSRPEARRKGSASSNGSGSGREDSISQLLKARGEHQGGSGSAAKLPFFEKYKQYVASNGNSNGTSSETPAPGLNSHTRRGSGSSSGTRKGDKLVSSPEQVARLRIEEESDHGDDDGSALPWATPHVSGSGSASGSRSGSRENSGDRSGSRTIGAESGIKRDKDSQSAPHSRNGSQDHPRLHQRYHTTDSEASSSSSLSSRSGRYGASGSGPESEEVVTPSQSWEGSLIDRLGVGLTNRDRDRDRKYPYAHDHDELEQIEEDEDEGEMVVFGSMTGGAQGKSRSHSQTRMKNSSSDSTITPQIPVNSSRDRERDRPTPISDSHRRAPSSTSSVNTTTTTVISSSHTDTMSTSSSSSASRRKQKHCQKCQQPVGGSARFVERDGVVLCEKDWKKMYLPSCRRCSLPIEKSAVSSSDGQLKGKWHKECFTCMRCDRPFEGDSFYVLGGKPWCQLHYHEEK